MALSWQGMLDELRRSDLLVSAPPAGPRAHGIDGGQPRGDCGIGVSGRPGLAGGRPPLCGRRGATGCCGYSRRSAIVVRGAGGRSARRAQGGARPWRRVVRAPSAQAEPGGRDRHQRQDHDDWSAAARLQPKRRHREHRHARRLRRSRGGGRVHRGHADHAGADRSPGHLRGDGGPWRAASGDGDVVAQPRPGAARRAHVRRGRLHQPDARPSRLPRYDGVLPRGQAQARRHARQRRCGGGESR